MQSPSPFDKPGSGPDPSSNPTSNPYGAPPNPVPPPPPPAASPPGASPYDSSANANPYGAPSGYAPGAQPGGTPGGVVPADANSKKMAAGLCGIFLGAFGVHKFILGYNTEGIIMVCTTVFTCGIAAGIVHIIGLVEGIMYLTKTDQDFYQTYIVNKKGWF